MVNFSGIFRLPMRADDPFKMGYDPELGVSPKLEPDAASYFQSIIDALKWMTKLGRIDIITKASLLLSHLALPR